MIEKNYGISGDIFLTIAHISDLHNKDGRQAIESMRNRKPDIIVITGDLVLRRRPTDDMLIVQSEKNVLPFLSECAQIATTYMSLGNHEIMLNQDDFDLIAQTGVELLDNRFVKTDKYVIGGLTSAYVSRYRREIEEMEAGEKAAEGTKAGRYLIPKPFWRPRMQESDYAWIDTFVKVPRYRILLSHHPEYWCLEEPMLINRNIDLVLSGHAHGGQFRLFGQGFFAPGQGWFPKFTSGIHRGKYGRMIISKGMANTVRVAPRLFNPTEVVYIEVEGGSCDTYFGKFGRSG